MKVIIAGSRSISSYATVHQATMKSGWKHKITTVISGGAFGVDAMGENWAKHHNIPFIRIKADWDTYGPSAGPIRNQIMAEAGDALIAVWDERSHGTKNMIQVMQKAGKPVYIHRVKV